MQQFDPENPYEPETGTGPNPGETGGRWDDPVAGGGGGCGAGTVPETIGADGNWRSAGPGECIDQSEFNRRVDLNIRNNPGPRQTSGGQGGGPTAPSGPAQYKFAPVPQFDAPEFSWSEEFRAPSLAEAKNEPGYQFASEEGRRALEQSAAAKGTLRTGGTLKDILGWGNRFAEQNYGNVFDRYARGYDTRFNTAKDKFGFQYQGAKDEYAPRLFEWQTKTAFGTNAAQQAWQKAWEDYFRSTLSASDIFGAGR